MKNKIKVSTKSSSTYSIKEIAGFNRLPVIIYLKPGNYSESELVKIFLDEMKLFIKR